MAAVRWAKDRERRKRMAERIESHWPGPIIRRIVVIDRESTVREAVIYETDSERDARRKLRSVLTAPSGGVLTVERCVS
jgi:alkyl hydroperoxide reductase subunit AhpC